MRRGYDPEIRRAAAREVLRGEKAQEVASRHGVSLTTVWNWVHAYEREEEEARRADEQRERALARIVARNADRVALAEIETDEGLVLAAVNIGRNGERTGTVQRLAGARVGTGGEIHGRVMRMWFVDPLLMRSVAEAHIQNGHKALT